MHTPFGQSVLRAPNGMKKNVTHFVLSIADGTQTRSILHTSATEGT